MVSNSGSNIFEKKTDFNELRILTGKAHLTEEVAERCSVKKVFLRCSKSLRPATLLK